MSAFRISRIQLRDLRRHRSFDANFAPGLTIVKGPNEAGKSTLAEAVELALTPTGGRTAAELRSWSAAPDAAPTVTIDFSVDRETGLADGRPDIPGVRAGQVTRTWGPAGVATTLTLDSTTISDPAAVDARLVELTGLPSAAFFRGTALVNHAELTGISSDSTIRQRLAASITAADRRTAAAKSTLGAALADLQDRGEGNPGRIGVAKAAVGRSATLVQTGDAGLARLATDRATAVDAEAAQGAATGHLTERRAMLEQARLAEKLTAERDAATDRAHRYAEAISIARDLATLATTHPSKEPLGILRQTVGRLTTLDGRINELKRLLEGEVQVDFEATAPEATWRAPTILGAIGLLLGIALVIAGVLLKGLTVLVGVGIGVGLIGLGLLVFARRRRSSAIVVDRSKQLADVQIDRRLRGRSQMENELKECEGDFSQQLMGIGHPDLATAQAELAQEEAHVARIDELTARLEGLVGRDAPETFPTSRDSALAAAANRSADLAKLPDEARADGARPRLEAEVTGAEASLEAARQAAATARAAVEANSVDSDQATGEAERLAVWQGQLARLQRKARIHEAALKGIERAEAATTALTTRYVERRVNATIAQMTGGRYRRVAIDDGSLAVRVFSADRNDWVPIESVSDGTAEQVLLAARIGLLGYVTGGQLPPLLLDDPFAAYDDARAAQSFDLLKQLAAGQQIVYLTASSRFDAAGDSVVSLAGPTALDGAGGPP
ncbi:MAG TPA: AAA family ATPase [Candidatus Limnocylindrales bacterium]